MPSFNVNVSVTEFLEECNPTQIKELVKILVEDEKDLIQKALNGEEITFIKGLHVNESIFEVDVDPDDYLDECSRYDRLKLVELLTYEGFIEEPRNIPDSEDRFDEALISLIGKRLILSKEQEEYIMKLSKEF